MNEGCSDNDMTDWFEVAAYRYLLRQSVIETELVNSGKLREFKVRMAAWSRTIAPSSATLVAGSRAFFEICSEFELLGLLGGWNLRGGGTSRAEQPREPIVIVGAFTAPGAAPERTEAALPKHLERVAEVAVRLARKYRDAG